MTLRQAILEVQKIGTDNGFTIVIVGGAMVRLIGPKTSIKKVDEGKRTIYLDHALDPNTTRPEDSKTQIDIDCIAFSNESDPFTKEVLDAFTKLKKAIKHLPKDFPAVSLEPVLYHPYFPKPNQLTQFVSSIESYHDTDFFFRLGTVKQDVKQQSLSFWTYICDDEQIMSFSPIAIQRRYSIRGFSAKPKDLEKIFGEKSVFADFVKSFNKKTNGMHEKDFTDWDEFATRVQHAKQPSMKLKKTLWSLYWQTIGTYLAHGTGLVGKLLFPLGNTFFAGK